MNQKRESKTKAFKASQAITFTAHELGNNWNLSWKRDPKSVLFMLARYKFASKMVTKNDDILEIGCGEGIGSAMLASAAKSYTGVEHDEDTFKTLDRLCNQNRKFLFHDILDGPVISGTYNVAISLDVVEHVYPEYQELFIENLCNSLSKRKSLLIIGSPSLESQTYASEVSKIGHVGCLTASALEILVSRHVTRSFCFSMNDEIVHTGFSKMSHYNIVIGVM